MSPITLQVWQVIAGLVTVVVTVLGPVLLALISLKQKMLEMQDEQRKIAGEMQSGVEVIKKHTNEMKDALVDTTRKLATLEGANIERLRAKAEDAAVTRGGAEERLRSDEQQAVLDTAEHTEKAAELLESIDEKTNEPKPTKGVK